MRSWTFLVDYLAKHKTVSWVFDAQSSDIYNARNSCVAPIEFSPYKEPLNRKPFNEKIDYTHILWIDSDMVFKTEDVLQIITHDADIVSGVCMKDFNTAGLGYWYEQDGNRYIAYLRMITKVDGEIKSVYDDWVNERGLPNGLVPIDFAGGAFLCVRRGVYEKVAYPWYQSTVAEFGERQIETSEDIGFCWRAQQAGFKMFADPKVKIGHEKRMPLWPR